MDKDRELECKERMGKVADAEEYLFYKAAKIGNWKPRQYGDTFRWLSSKWLLGVTNLGFREMIGANFNTPARNTKNEENPLIDILQSSFERWEHEYADQ